MLPAQLRRSFKQAYDRRFFKPPGILQGGFSVAGFHRKIWRMRQQ